MTDPRTSEPVPTAQVAAPRRLRLSPIWVVPLVALAVGGWFVWKAWSEQGPVVTIRFPDAEGLAVDKTTVRYKDVEIGTVTELRMSADLTEVVVTAQLTRGWQPYLTSGAKFWVVKPRISAGRVSGLGTLISGAYIGMQPGRGGEPRRNYQGLTSPPGVPEGTPGAHFILRADDLGSLEVGSPIYFRRLRVGEVSNYRLTDEGDAVEISVFVHAPYDERVTRNTRFWNASGLDIDLSAEGLRVDSQSLVSLLIGGIAFGTPGGSADEPPVPEGTDFPLFASRAEARQRAYASKERFVLHFRDSVRGLSVGAPVEFRGIKVGQVLDLNLEFNAETLGFRIPVLVELEPERVTVVEGKALPDRNVAAYLVRRGLRARLQMGNLLTGQLLVGLDMHPEAPEAPVETDRGHVVIPTIPAPLQELRTGLVDLMKRLEALPLEEIAANLKRTSAGADRLVNGPELAQSLETLRSTLDRADSVMLRLDEQTLSLASDVLEQARRSLQAAETSVGQESPLQSDLRQALQEVTSAARSLRTFTDYLGRHPEALLRGKGPAQ